MEDLNKLDLKISELVLAWIESDGTPRNHLKLELAGQAGSDRTYYRLSAEGKSWVLQLAQPGDELKRYLQLGRSLHGFGLPVPRILCDDFSSGQTLIEDLGKVSLFDAVQNTGSSFDLYRRTLSSLLFWQQQSESLFKDVPWLADKKFDEKALRWETSYFSEHFCKNFLKVNLPESVLAYFDVLAQRVASHSGVLMHRDFQSQNIMVPDGIPVFIDFQGAFNGSVFYDLASLLWDPYVMLENSAVFKHVDFFIGESVLLSQNSREVYFNQFIDASLQRIMQACGAYCFLSQVKNKVAFKHHILPGAQRLMELLQLSNDQPAHELCEIISNGLCEISLKTELST